MPLVRFGPILVLTMAIGVSVLTAPAEAGPRTETRTCASMQQTIERSGSAIFQFRRSNRRFVRHEAYCSRGQRVRWQIVRSSDQRRCGLKVCRSVNIISR